MKNLILLLVAMLPLCLKAQLNQWSPIQPLTDSAHFNRNAAFVNDDNYIHFLFWDQQTGNSTTRICYRDISTFPLGAEKIAQSLPDVQLTNPEIINLSYSSQPLNFLVIYQTNEGADINLKCIEYRADGSFSEPFPVSHLPGNDVNAVVVNTGVVAWENSGKIWVSQYLIQSNSFSIPYAVDSVGTSSPSFSQSGFSYLKSDGDSTHVISCQLHYNQVSWEKSNVSSQSYLGECTALTTNNSLWGINQCMQSKVGSQPSGLVIFDGWGYGNEYLNSPTYNFSQPAVCDYMIGVKSYMYVVAYVSDSLVQKEIFVSSPFMGFSNISQWQGDDIHPRIFETFPSSFTIRINLSWESERYGFSTIYRSSYDYLFGGTEEKTAAATLIVKPCPFDREAEISFQSSGHTLIRIVDLQGREVKTLVTQKGQEGFTHATWDGTDRSGNNLPSGSYAVIATTGNSTVSKIIIKE